LNEAGGGPLRTVARTWSLPGGSLANIPCVVSARALSVVTCGVDARAPSVVTCGVDPRAPSVVTCGVDQRAPSVVTCGGARDRAAKYSASLSMS
jgi:hypothetical protein